MRSSRGIEDFTSIKHAELFTSLDAKINNPAEQQRISEERRRLKLQIASDYLEGKPNLNKNQKKGRLLIEETSETVIRPKLITKENMYWLWASFSTYRLFILRLMHFLKSIGKILVFRFFSVLSLSYFGEIAYYGYHLCKEAKNAMSIADASLEGWQWLKNRVNTFFTCLKNGWDEDPQRRYKIKNAVLWSAVNLCTYLLPAGVLAVIIINLIGFGGDIGNEIQRRLYDVKMAEELRENIKDDGCFEESVEQIVKNSKQKRNVEVVIVTVLFTCMIFYFVPFVNVALIAATAIILAISTFFVLRNLYNLSKSIRHHCSQNEIALSTIDNKPSDTLKPPSSPNLHSTASVLTCYIDNKSEEFLPQKELERPLLRRYAESTPILSTKRKVKMTISKSEGDLVNLPDTIELELLEKWIKKVKEIIKTNSLSNLAIILQNLTLQETRELRTILGLQSHQVWRQRLKEWIRNSEGTVHSNNCRLFNSYTLLGALETQYEKNKAQIEVLKKAQPVSPEVSSKIACN